MGSAGAGNTHTIASSLLTVLECQPRTSQPLIIFLTAMTHTAIDACLSILRSLITYYRPLPDHTITWLDKMRI
jgi:hypothetical protein